MRIRNLILFICTIITIAVCISAVTWSTRQFIRGDRDPDSTEFTYYGDPYESTSEDIGEEGVMAIVLERIPGATSEDIIRMDYEMDGRHVKYDGKVMKDRISYLFTIDGSDGTILKWEVED